MNDSWDKLLLRLKSCAYKECRGRGMNIIVVRLALRSDELVAWSEPEVKRYEHPDQSSRECLLDWLAKS